MKHPVEAEMKAHFFIRSKWINARERITREAKRPWKLQKLRVGLEDECICCLWLRAASLCLCGKCGWHFCGCEASTQDATAVRMSRRSDWLSEIMSKTQCLANAERHDILNAFAPRAATETPRQAFPQTNARLHVSSETTIQKLSREN